MPSRRTFRTLASVATATVAGCLGTSKSTEQADKLGSQPIPGEAPAITVEKSLSPDKHTYIERNDTVRYPASMSQGEISEYKYAPFDHWATVEGASVAADVIRKRVRNEL